MSNKITNVFVNSCYVSNDNSDAVIVTEKNIDTGKNRFNIIENPNRPFWVTKPGLRIHKDKREYELDNNLDQYIVRNKEVPNKLAEVLNVPGRSSYKFNNFKVLCDSPYVYGADIDIECLVKMAYSKKQQDISINYNVGMLDIETSMLGGYEVILITFIDGNRNVYTSIYEPFLKGISIEEAKQVIFKKLDEFKEALFEERDTIKEQKLSEKVKKLYNLKPFNFNFYTSNNELDIIKWIFDRIHESEVDFIGIWNMGFDIPYLIKRIEFRQGDILEIMSHPKIPKRLRRVEWIEDKSKLDHFTDRWDWFVTTSYYQFIDSMCLYSRIRKVKGRDISYKLDYISSKLLGTGKLNIGNKHLNHTRAQQDNFLEYIAYNIVDVLLMVLIEDMEQDITTLNQLIGNSKLHDFNKQTVQLKNMFYEYCRERKCVPCSIGTTMATKHDIFIASSGGAVLSPHKTKDTGVAILEESSESTRLHKGMYDIDVSSQYPNTTAAFNIAKETKLHTCIDIEGFGIPDIKLSEVISNLPDMEDHRNALQQIYDYIKNIKSNLLNKVLNQPVEVDKKVTSIVKLLDMFMEKPNNKSIASSIAIKLVKARAILNANFINDFFTNISAPYENSVYIANKFFSLPDYEEMQRLFSENE